MEIRSSTVMDKLMADKVSIFHVILSIIDGQWNQLRHIVVDPISLFSLSLLSFLVLPFSFTYHQKVCLCSVNSKVQDSQLLLLPFLGSKDSNEVYKSFK